MNNSIVSSFYLDLKRRPELQAVIPMGYNPGIPMLSVKQDNLCLIIPFLRYKIIINGEKKQTLVFPIRYVVEYLIPERQLVRIEDLAFSKYAEKVDFDKACGLFKHEAIANFTQQEYKMLRTDTLKSYDKAVDVLLNGKSYLISDLNLMASQLQTIVEPSLWAFYKSIEPQFFNKYFTYGKN